MLVVPYDKSITLWIFDIALVWCFVFGISVLNGKFIWVKTAFFHFHSDTEEIIIAFAPNQNRINYSMHFQKSIVNSHLLSFGFLPCFTPNVNTMSSHQNGCWSRISPHCFVHTLFKIFFEWRVFNNWHYQLLIISQITA